MDAGRISAAHERTVHDRPVRHRARGRHLARQHQPRHGGGRRRVLVRGGEPRRQNVPLGPAKYLRSPVHPADPEGDGRGRADAVPQVSGGRLPDRGDPLGARWARAPGRHAPEGTDGRDARDQGGAEGARFRRVHLLGSEQTGSQCATERRGDRDSTAEAESVSLGDPVVERRRSGVDHVFGDQGRHSVDDQLEEGRAPDRPEPAHVGNAGRSVQLDPGD
uniref:(northern house mosquito) hypothetical protein n=1 Tax=Culex pipiens TaxID=7175 RepID=A0A8D8J9D4_CULPI